MGWIRRCRVTRWQLEQHVERRAVHGESEQWANEHEQQHRVPLRLPSWAWSETWGVYRLGF